MSYLDLVHKAQNDKIVLTQKVKREINALYKETLEELTKKSFGLEDGSITKAWVISYSKSLKAEMNKLESNLSKVIINYSTKAAELGTLPIDKYFNEINNKFDLNLDKSLSNILAKVPTNVVDGLIAGGFYKDGAGLSARIYKDFQKQNTDIDFIIAKAIIDKKSIKELAKDLETYIDPDVKKTWEFSKVYPGTKLKVDYNAQRLARTSINHAFYMSNIRTCKGNPFITAMHWSLSNSHYERQVKPWGEDVCDDYAKENSFGLGTGNFPIDNVPVPHPQCLCSQYPVIQKTMKEIGTELRQWLDGKENKELDNWLGTKSTKDKPQKEKDVANETQKEYNKSKVIENANDIPVWATMQIDDFTKEEQEALTEYTNADFSKINEFLRGRISAGENVEKLIEHISNALSKSVFPEDITLWRGAHAVNFEGSEMLMNLPPSEWINKTITDKAFSSTTIIKGKELDGEVKMEILAPKGSKGAFIDPISYFKDIEYEVLLPNDSQFKILAVREEKDYRGKNVYYVTAKLVN